ncbi:MAG: hypothetical protein DRP87_06100 [Spirochaetes bacterium]|nr:MAG: hypothetical protein DRP87_06100 [Spirochaetota bacterium]
MKNAKGIEVLKDLPEGENQRIAELFWEAFGSKYKSLYINKDQGIAIVRDSLRFDQGLYACLSNRVVGFLGFHYGSHRFTDFRFDVFRRQFSLPGALLRFSILTTFLPGRIKEPGEIRIDSVAVDSELRGKGIGTTLIEEAISLAKKMGFRSIRLEVIDSNERAKKLYERLGFKTAKYVNFGILARGAGFSGEYVMRRYL